MAPQQPEHPDLSSAQERAVRDLLAGARHTGPVPDDVAARLDATLADLAAERVADPTTPTTSGGTDDAPAAEPDATVVPLARRRRRRIGLGLVAAAAVVVGGVAVTQVLPQMSGEDTATSEAGGESALDAGAGRDRSGAAQEGSASAGSRVPRLSPESFRRDVLRARGMAERGVLDASSASDARGVEGQAESESGAERDRRAPGPSPRALADQCGIDAGPGRLVVVRYAGRRGLLVLRPPEGDRQRADLFPCGAAEPLRTVVLPVR